MEKIVVKGGKKLKGVVRVDGSKNAALPILAAMLLFENAKITLLRVPKIKDVLLMLELLKQLGLRYQWKAEALIIETPSRAAIQIHPPENFVSKMRATLLILGPLLSVKEEVFIGLPGGCSIGYRPINIHVDGLKAMGATFDLNHGTMKVVAENGLKSQKITLDYPSVGATENIIMAAVLTEGMTVIENAAKEPEVIDLIRFLNHGGAKINGAGTSVIEIIGVSRLNPELTYEVIPDRVEAATYMIAAAVSNGDILIEDAIPQHLMTVISKLREIGVDIELNDNDSIRVKGKSMYSVKQSVDITTAPYPGFHTDIQVLMLPLLLKLDKGSTIVENVFDRRFIHVEEFTRVGANLLQIENMLIVNPAEHLFSGQLEAHDVRSTAALILLGLSNDIHLEISGLEHLYRGYAHLIPNLKSLGADITLEESEKNG